MDNDMMGRKVDYISQTEAKKEYVVVVAVGVSVDRVED